MTEDRNDYFAAFAIGAIVGIGATLLLAPEKPTGARRLLHEIEPKLRTARKRARRFGKDVSRATRRARGGRRILRDFR
jgi:gas vesicle protein